MTLFRRRPPPEVYDDPQSPLEAYERADDMPMGEPRNVVDFTPKPPDLERAASTREWTRPLVPAEPQTSPETLTVAPQAAPPHVQGVWWYREPGSVCWRWCVVLSVGGRLCVCTRQGDSAKYTSVSALRREWAGPSATPAGVPLEDLSP